MEKIIEMLTKDLANNYHEEDVEVITNLYTLYSGIASNTSNRKKDDELLIPYIYTAIKEAYLRRGDEGTSSTNEGGLSASYIDIEEKLRNDTRSIRKGAF